MSGSNRLIQGRGVGLGTNAQNFPSLICLFLLRASTDVLIYTGVGVGCGFGVGWGFGGECPQRIYGSPTCRHAVMNRVLFDAKLPN
jgi:hypothetical protein